MPSSSVTSDTHTPMPLDTRIIVYSWVKRVGGIVAVAALLKLLVVDTIAVRTEQMSPDLQRGDRIVISRLSALLPSIISLRRGKVVVFREPGHDKRFACLRVAGLAGDSLSIEEGQLTVNGASARWGMPLLIDPLPAEYGPRDFTPALRVPKAGDTINLSTSSLRDFFFAASVIAQENPRKRFRTKPQVAIDGQRVENFVVKDFSFYQGPIDSVPAARDLDWVFWDRLVSFLRQSLPEKTVEVSFQLSSQDQEIQSYRFKESCIFLLADDWESGYDSRYFGPVPYSRLQGSAVSVLWSLDPDRSGLGKLRIKRIGRLLRTRDLTGEKERKR